MFMLVESPCFTVYSHYIEIDEHSEKEVRNEVKSEGEGGVVTGQEEGMINEITKRIREQMDFQLKKRAAGLDTNLGYLKIKVIYMVCEENQMGVLTKKRLWIKDILLERVHEYHPYDEKSHRKIVRKINPNSE